MIDEETTIWELAIGGLEQLRADMSGSGSPMGMGGLCCQMMAEEAAPASH